MQKPKFIQKMIAKNNERMLNKPRYKIENLYIGEIIYITNTQPYVGPTASIFDSGTRKTFNPIKKFAIFYHNPYMSQYLHIFSNHEIRTTSMWAESGEYCVNYESIKKFDRIMQRFMMQNKLTSNSKLSIKQITELENMVNERLFPNQYKDELFWGN